MKQILIIDDEEKLRSLLAKIIGLEGFEVLQAGDGKTGMKKLEQHNIDVVICDVKLPDGSGVDLAKKIKEDFPAIEIILLTAYGNISDGVQAIKNGAFDYITKGDDNNKIIPLLYKAAEKVSLSKRLLQLEKQLGYKYSFDSIIGHSKIIQSAIASAKKVSATDASVLLTGETLKPIYQYLQARGSAKSEEPLFSSLSHRNGGDRLTTRTARRIIKARFHQIGIDSDRLTAHSLRHTAVTLSLKAGSTIQEAQALARHTNINTTLIYAQNIDRIKQAPERKIDALIAGNIGNIGNTDNISNNKQAVYGG